MRLSAASEAAGQAASSVRRVVQHAGAVQREVAPGGQGGGGALGRGAGEGAHGEVVADQHALEAEPAADDVLDDGGGVGGRVAGSSAA